MDSSVVNSKLENLTHQKRDSEELGGQDIFKLHLESSVWKEFALDKSVVV